MKPETAQTRDRTSLEPVTTIEDIPVLNVKERADLIGSLQEAEADIAAGKGVEFDRTTFKERLVSIYRRHRR